MVMFQGSEFSNCHFKLVRDIDDVIVPFGLTSALANSPAFCTTQHEESFEPGVQQVVGNISSFMLIFCLSRVKVLRI